MSEKILCILMTALMALTPLSALGESFAGTWEGEKGTLVLDEEGLGTLTDAEGISDVRVSDGRLYAGDTALGTLRFEDGNEFLILTDGKGESWPMIHKADALPEISRMDDIQPFLGLWEADFALVSGFRIAVGDLQAESGETVCVRYEIGTDGVRLSGTGYTETVTLPAVLDTQAGGLRISLSDGESWTLYLLEDGSLIRETEAMTLHLIRQPDDDGEKEDKT